MLRPQGPKFRSFLALLVLLSVFAAHSPTASAQSDFRRGDADGDGVAGTVSDVNFLNRALTPFVGGPPPFLACVDAGDINDDGLRNLADSILLLDAITGTLNAAPPGLLTCGPDPTDDPLTCQNYSCVPTPLPQISTATLRLESEFGAVGDTLTVRLFLESTAEAADLPVGFAASIAHDPSIATASSVVIEDLPSTGTPQFKHFLIEPGTVSVASLGILGQPLSSLVAVITYELVGPGTTALTLIDAPLRTEVTGRLGYGGFPLLIEGEIGVHEFRRGDANNDTLVNIADPISILGTLFGGDPALPCADAADVNDDGLLDLGDAISALNYVFGAGAQTPAPGPLQCGPDPTPDALRCSETICP